MLLLKVMCVDANGSHNSLESITAMFSGAGQISELNAPNTISKLKLPNGVMLILVLLLRFKHFEL